MMEELDEINKKPSPETSPATEKEKYIPPIKIVSWNANLPDNRRYSDLETGLKNFVASGADIILVQETGINMLHGNRANFRKIQDELGPNWEVDFTGATHSYINPDGTFSETQNEGGLMVIANRNSVQIKQVQSITLPSTEKLTFTERHFTIGGKPDQRRAQIIRASVEDEEITIINYHGDWQGGASHRKKQMQHLGNYIRQSLPSDRILVMGDFNIISNQESADAAKLLSSDLIDKKVTNFTKVRPRSATKRLFGVLEVNPDFAYQYGKVNIIQSETLVESFGSDHHPVSYQIELIV